MKRILLALGLAASLFAAAGPAEAHKDHAKKVAEEKAAAEAKAAAAMGHDPAAHAAMPAAGAAPAAAQPGEAEAPPAFIPRSLSWIGRLHPFAVHFPIALFPISWLALLFARRRGDRIDVIRSLIVVCGFSSAAAALLGWPNGGGPGAETVFAIHRWLGTALGVAGLGIGVAALRSTTASGSRAMLWTLGIATLAILVQGWLGGALVHGVDHLAW